MSEGKEMSPNRWEFLKKNTGSNLKEVFMAKAGTI